MSSALSHEAAVVAEMQHGFARYLSAEDFGSTKYGCVRAVAEPLADEVVELRELSASLLAALRDLYDLIDCGSSPDAFKNGVTDSTGSIDEGDVRASRYMDAARAVIAKAEGRS